MEFPQPTDRSTPNPTTCQRSNIRGRPAIAQIRTKTRSVPGYYKTNIKGAPRGKLKGKRIALKDNVCLTGVPMMCGASTMEGYVPDIDATIVTRILHAGGEIAGKTNCEYFFSGSSHTNAIADTHNPYRHGITAGGSSSGSAAAVASGDVEMAIGGDQAGSIRNPASFCGLYGMKATWDWFPIPAFSPSISPSTMSDR